MMAVLPARLRMKFNDAHDAQGRFAETDGGGGRSAVRSRRAEVGELHPAEKVGKGKDSQIVMADGSEAPAHIKPGMIPPAYAHNIQVSKNADADVWAISEDEDGNSKRVYNPKFIASNQDLKWGRVNNGVDQAPQIRQQIQADRSGPNKDEADAAWLMSEQATRPGSEEDTKGNKALWSEPVTKDNFEVTPDKKGGVPKVVMKVGGSTIPLRDEGTREEIASRIASGKSLEDAGYWLKSHGATTLEGRHVVPTEGGGARIQFQGKEGVWHDHEIQDPKLAKMLLDRKASAGDKGNLFGTDYNSTAKYVGKLGDGTLSPKDLRTIRANELAQKIVGNGREFANEKARKAYITEVGTKVSNVLGNRAKQALESYIDPRVFDKVKLNERSTGKSFRGEPATRLAEVPNADSDGTGRSGGYRGRLASGRGVREGDAWIHSDRQATKVATALGYSRLCSWVDSLPPRYDALHALLATGRSDSRDEVALQLDEAVAAHGDDPGAVAVAKALATELWRGDGTVRLKEADAGTGVGGGVYFRTIDGIVRPLRGTDPDPAESARYLKHRSAEIHKAMLERKSSTVHVRTESGDHVINHDLHRVTHTDPEGTMRVEYHNTQGEARRAAAAHAAKAEHDAMVAGKHLGTESGIQIDEETASAIKAGHLTIPTEHGEVDEHLVDAYRREAAKTGHTFSDFKIDRETGQATAKVTDRDGNATGATNDDAGRGRGAQSGDAEAGQRVAEEAVPSRDAETREGGENQHQPPGQEPAKSVPADIKRVNDKIDRLKNFFRSKGQGKSADFLQEVQNHVNTVGVKDALDSLGEAKGGPQNVDYLGADVDPASSGSISDFSRAYLKRNGIQVIGDASETSGESPIISSWADQESAGVAGDFLPKNPTLANKLEEAKHLPGLERSEAIPEGVTHLTPKVMQGFDKKFGKGQWIAKPYGENAQASIGIMFPQRAEQIMHDAQMTIHAASDEVGKYGFSLERDEDGKVIGLKHSGGDTYEFGTDKYNNTINGHVRHWGDLAANAADNEHGAALADGGKEYMVQPAFHVVGLSDADRAAGVEKAATEGGVHIITRDGKAEVVPGATWLKNEYAPGANHAATRFPVIFKTPETQQMEQAAVDAINKLPESERMGQVYRPDVVKTDQGYRVVEANPMTTKVDAENSQEVAGSAMLADDPITIDSYVSHIVGKDPAHVAFLRNLLSKREYDGIPEARGGVGGGGQGRLGGGTSPEPGGSDSGSSPKFQGGAEAAEGKSPEALASAMKASGVRETRPSEDAFNRSSYQQRKIDEWHNQSVLDAAKKNGSFVPAENFAEKTRSPNQGGNEHDVHFDPSSNRFYKFTGATGEFQSSFGTHDDIYSYLKNTEALNRLSPELGIKVHGITQSPFTGRAQLVTSVNRIAGTHPSESEVVDHLRSQGWKPVDAEGAPDNELTEYAWRDPKSGTVISDVHAGNWIKTESGKMVPIDMTVTPGRKSRKSWEAGRTDRPFPPL